MIDVVCACEGFRVYWTPAIDHDWQATIRFPVSDLLLTSKVLIVSNCSKHVFG